MHGVGGRRGGEAKTTGGIVMAGPLWLHLQRWLWIASSGWLWITSKCVDSSSGAVCLQQET